MTIGHMTSKREEKEPQKWIWTTSLLRRGTQRSQDAYLDGSQEYFMNPKTAGKAKEAQVGLFAYATSASLFFLSFFFFF